MAYSVLIVDASLTVRMDLRDAYEAAGFRATPCATGAQARAALAGNRYDAVVLGMLLPDTDGVRLLAEVRNSAEGAVVLLLAAADEVRDRLRNLGVGADEYVAKPYDADRLVARTRQLLDAPADEGAQPPDGRTVLVIDDSRTFREELRRVLEREKYTVVTADSGEEGLRVAADVRPHAILVDGVMPGIDGATVIRRVRLDPALRDVPCLLLTAAEDYATELQVLDAGADGFVRKQEDMAVVLAKLSAVLRRSGDGLPIAAGGAGAGPATVLAVDSDTERLRTVGELLRAEGHRAVLTDSLDDAVRVLAAEPVDCVLLDLAALGADGRAAGGRIRSVSALRDLPLVLTGERDDPETLLDCLAAGADDYLPRSDDLETLRAHVRARIRRKQLQDESRRLREELLRGQLDAAEARAARQLAETRAALVEELAWRNRELEAFTGSVSHDLRTPLQVILGFAESLLDEDADRLGEQAVHRLTRIQTAATRMAELVESLLLLSRASRAELAAEPVDLSALAGEVVQEQRRRDPARQVQVSIADSMVAHGDPGLLKVVLENLVGNAWKFTRRTGRPVIAIGCRVDHGKVAYFVRDNGAGFPSEQADRLFRPFGRLHPDQDFPGTGIGLTTVHRIVERHGGQVWAEGAVGQGATVYFTLG